ncbi:MAG: divergent polysaccharide deacetylase family protein [Rhodovibrio sp.]|nr:divergent polysaccharide deacetylase family protein [Rhodovibrio sp.]
MPEISRARQRAIAREARKYGPTGYTARQLVAVALGLFVAGAAIGTTAGLLLGGAGEPEAVEVAEQRDPAPPTLAPPTPAPTVGDRAQSNGAETGQSTSRTPTSGYANAPEAADPAPTDAPEDLTHALAITDRIVADGRRQAEAAEAAQNPSEAPPAWQRNAAAYPEPGPGVAKIAVVIDDLGLNRSNARETLALPGPLTLAFMTYAPSPGELTRAARAAGHELLVHVPMQPSDTATDPGPKVLSGALDRAELLARLEWGLSRFDGYVGINNHMGSAFTRDSAGMRAVLGELKRRGLMFLDSRTIASSVAGPLAKEMGVAHATRDVFLDNQRDLAAIRAQLAEAERIAKETGSAVAIGHPYDETIQALKAWLPTLGDKNIALVPISALAKDRGPDVAQLPAGGE